MSDIVGGGMSDKAALPDIDLRTRIAQVLYARHQAKLAFGKPWSELPPVVQGDWLNTAGAVIAELNLHPEYGQRSNATGILWGSQNRHNVTRYVTDWKADDE